MTHGYLKSEMIYCILTLIYAGSAKTVFDQVIPRILNDEMLFCNQLARDAKTTNAHP